MTEKPIIALLYDFDKTLCTTDMEDYAFIPALGYTPAEFWSKANTFGRDNRMDGLLAYMYTMIEECRAQGKRLDRELLVRWFEWGCFCPVFRMHGERSPWYEREQEFIDNVRQRTSGQDNEVWSFGEDNYEILKKYLFVRENMRPYIRKCMRAASETGAPVMRTLSSRSLVCRF